MASTIDPSMVVVGTRHTRHATRKKIPVYPSVGTLSTIQYIGVLYHLDPKKNPRLPRHSKAYCTVWIDSDGYHDATRKYLKYPSCELWGIFITALVRRFSIYRERCLGIPAAKVGCVDAFPIAECVKNKRSRRLAGRRGRGGAKRGKDGG